MKLGATAQIYQSMPMDWMKTTHLAIGAHQDDLEIMATHGIVQGMNSEKEWFTGVVVTNGAGSVAGDGMGEMTRREIAELRSREQIAAAQKGQYLGVIQLGYESKDVKTPQLAPASDIKEIIAATKPQVIYTHNPLDRHLTHVGVFVHVLKALRDLEYMPSHFFGCEVWRALDWLPETRKVPLPIDCDDQFVLDLISCHQSQTVNGKGFDQATLGRMKANAAYLDSHSPNGADKIWLALDLLPLLEHPQVSPEEFVEQCLVQFKNEVFENLAPLAEESAWKS